MFVSQDVQAHPAELTLPHPKALRALVHTTFARTSLVDMLLLLVRYHADEIAVSDDSGTLRYSALADRAARLASRLKQAGVGPDARVGLFVEPSIDMMVGLWGILFSGGAYLPLGADYPIERLTYMIRDAGIKVIITQKSLSSRLAEIIIPGIQIIALDTLSDTLDEEDIYDFEAPTLLGSSLAYMIYTSGTTGAPKGVCISHAAIVNQLAWLQSEQKVHIGEVILQKTPASFDAAQWELLAVCCGVHVVMGRPGVYRDPPAMIEQIRQHRVTMLQGVPTLLQALVDHPEFEQCSTLTSVFSGGEALTKKLAARILEAKPGCRLVNLYGPTECTINTTSYTVAPSILDHCPEVIPIGRPVANTTCYVLDEQMNPVEDGATGELHIAGTQLADGYYNRKGPTTQCFVNWIDRTSGVCHRVYKTGDLVRRDSDGTLHFQGRTDNQVKFRGYRIELDEIRVAIENHDWVKSAGVFVKEHPRTGQPILAAGIELNSREAQLMDQGTSQAHHQSKNSRLQVRAQLANAGLRTDADLNSRISISLPGADGSFAQRAMAFARKSYRFFEGGTVTVAELLTLLAQPEQEATQTNGLTDLTLETLGFLLRNLGPFTSNERLLSKFAYASPGALYATQIYLELSGVADIQAGFYYYHPSRHHLVLTSAKKTSESPRLRLHFVGKYSAIEPVYKNNIREVLELETGHILGLLDHVLPAFGLGIGHGYFDPSEIENLACSDGHAYLASFDVTQHAARKTDLSVDLYIQAHGDRVAGLSQGQYVHRNGTLDSFSRHILEQRHVIAINQRVYQRSSGIISMVSRKPESWHAYIDLGRTLQRLQHNSLCIGTMSSGYSSKSGNDLAAALRLREVLSEHSVVANASYCALFGKISESQLVHEGMNEDTVHMEGPAELIRKDLKTRLPDYMIPSKLALISRMPYSASGKVDINALKALPEFEITNAEREIIPPRTPTESGLLDIWQKKLVIQDLSVHDDFFEIGGDSLKAVQLVLSMNKTLGLNLPLQVLFEDPSIANLARRIDNAAHTLSRAVPLKKGTGRPIFCWPGLGGYPMSLRSLAMALDNPRPFTGVQALGVNAGEDFCTSIQDMALRDVHLIREVQPEGPYTLWGYSFGARVAYETAWQLEQVGEVVDELILIAPGSPLLPGGDPIRAQADILFRDPSFLTILYSVFAQTIAAERVVSLIKSVKDEQSFVSYVCAEKPELDVGVIARISRLVAQTYAPGYGLQMEERRIAAPTLLLKARGDNLSFLEAATTTLIQPARIVGLAPDHYELLKQNGVGELIQAIHRYAPTWQRSYSDLAVQNEDSAHV
ncbi:amino acid adenylation domain-containing protein [Alcaligenes sp. SDU_A2]|uniref:amino acid adenylation domain-containing protein n=1 Tax=Alcaligenes sp. SDU_A2 TaxID=3136634 RepID=UPI00311DC74E